MCFPLFSDTISHELIKSTQLFSVRVSNMVTYLILFYDLFKKSLILCIHLQEPQQDMHLHIRFFC